jgi:phage FluMu protein Com
MGLVFHRAGFPIEVYDDAAVPDLLTFAVRFTFACPLCKQLNDQKITIKAINPEAAQQDATGRLIRCAFCPAKVGADAAMVRVGESEEQER